MSKLSLLTLGAWLALAVACGSKPGLSAAEYTKRGDAAMAQKKYNDALIEYKNAMKATPRSGEAHGKVAEALLKSGDIRKASVEFVRAADLSPTDLNAQLRAGQGLLLVGAFEDAKSRADKILAVDPKHLEGLILRGNSQAYLRDMDRAMEDMHAAIKADSGKSVGYSGLGALQIAKGELKEAEITLKKAVLTSPKAVPAHLALANLYWAMGRLEDTEASIKSALDLDPSNLLANHALSALYLGSKRVREAEAPLKTIAAAEQGTAGRLALADYYSATQRLSEAKTVLEALAKVPDGETAAKLRLASLGVTEGDKAGAYRLVDEVLKKNPRNVEALIARTQLLLADGKADEAQVTIREAIVQDNNAPQAHYLLGTILALNNDNEGAQASQLEALRANPRFAPADVELARMAILEARFKDAVRFSEEAIRAVPTYADGYLMLARAHLANGNPASAEAPLRLLSTSFPDTPVVQAEVGRLLAAKGDQAGARAAFEKAIAKDPNQLSGIEGLSVLDVRQNRSAAAKARIDAAVAAGQKNAEVQMMASRVYLAMGDQTAAERTLKQALSIDASKLEAYAMLAQMYYKQKRLPEATAEFEKLSARQPKAVAPSTAVGVLLTVQDKMDAAKTQYERVLQLDPRASVAANNLAQIYSDRNENLDVALQLAQTAKLGLPNSHEIDDTIGWIYYKKKMPAPAIASLKRAVGSQPQNAEYLYHLGAAYAQNNDKVLARQNLEKALGINSTFPGASDARTLLNGLKG